MLRKKIGLLTLALLASIAWVVPTQAIESFGVGAVPAKPRANNTRSESIFVHTLQPGQTVKDAIRVANNSDKEKTISIYPVDSEGASDGAFACAQAAEEKKGVGKWIKLEKTEVTLKPATNEVIDFTITVPKNASVGEHNGCIAIQDMKRNEATGNGIVLSFRSALRVAILIPGEVKTELAFESLSLKLEKDKAIVTPELKNTGNVSLDARIQAKIKNIFGMSVGSSDGQFPLLRDTTGKFNIELNRPFWGGFYYVSTDVTYHQLQTGGEKTEDEGPISSGHWEFIAPTMPALLIELAILVAVIAAIGFSVWRSRQNKLLHTKSRWYVVAKGDDIQSIAEDFGVKWQLIAKVNKMNPPYSLRVGQRIKVPKN